MLVSANQLDEIKEMLNGLYAKDKTLSTQQELLEHSEFNN